MFILVLIKDKRGDTLISTLAVTLMVFLLIGTFISIFPVFTAKLNVNYAAGELVRTIELSGEKGAPFTNELARLKAETGLNMNAQVSGNFRGNKIQLREAFSVTVTTTCEIKIFQPALSDPICVRIPVSKSMHGRGGVYWKNL